MNNDPRNHRPPHVVVYFSDTGGGHRSAAEAIIEALQIEYGDSLTVEMVDALKNFAPLPLNKMPELYPQMVKAPKLWEASFYATNGRARVRLLTASVWPYVRRSVRAMIRSHPADLIVTVHPFANTFALKALGANRPPFFTVVTDLVTTHALWFDKRADKIFVPTERARQRALAQHMPAEKLEVAGLPVAHRYSAPHGDKKALRKKLGWPLDKFIVLIVGGGEGMGPIAQTARAIDESGLNVALVIAAGRNARLKSSLEAHKWENQAFVYGFTREMPEFMRASDVIVSKAGPGTIVEALNADLPIILYAKLAGQEDGNVTFVEETGAGVFAPAPQLVVRALTRWICHPDEYEQRVKNARRAARPDAARTIARAIGERLRLKPAPKTRLRESKI
jgi:1,2-diacylglycerol 3-beta-galactosyltransferase